MAEQDAPVIVQIANELSGGHGYLTLHYVGDTDRRSNRWQATSVINRRRERIWTYGRDTGDAMSKLLRIMLREKEKREGEKK